MIFLGLIYLGKIEVTSPKIVIKLPRTYETKKYLNLIIQSSGIQAIIEILLEKQRLYHALYKLVSKVFIKELYNSLTKNFLEIDWLVQTRFVPFPPAILKYTELG